jgi:hypothetical protein
VCVCFARDFALAAILDSIVHAVNLSTACETAALRRREVKEYTTVSKRGGPEGERARKTHFREVLEPGWEHAGSGSETGREALTGYESKFGPKRRYRVGRWGEGEGGGEAEAERTHKLIYLICSEESFSENTKLRGGGLQFVLCFPYFCTQQNRVFFDELPEGVSDTLPHTQALIKNGNGENGKRGSRISELSNAKPEEAMQCESALCNIYILGNIASTLEMYRLYGATQRWAVRK